MVRLENVTKRFAVRGGYNYVARNLTFTFPAGKSVGLLGRIDLLARGLCRIVPPRIDRRAEHPLSGAGLRGRYRRAGGFRA